MELLRVYDKNGQYMNLKKDRYGETCEGDYYRIVVVFTMNEDGKLLLTLRSDDKKVYPNTWEVTGGAVIEDEDLECAAIREVKEETNIKINKGQLHKVYETTRHNLFVTVYCVKTFIDTDKIVFQEGETKGYKLVTFEEMDEICKNGEIMPAVKSHYEAVKPKLIEIRDKM